MGCKTTSNRARLPLAGLFHALIAFSVKSSQPTTRLIVVPGVDDDVLTMAEASAECGMTVPELIDFLVMTGDLLLAPDDGDQPAYVVPEWNRDVQPVLREGVIPEQTEGK